MDIVDIEVDPLRTEDIVVTGDEYIQDQTISVPLFKKNTNNKVENKGNGLMDMTFLYSDDETFLKDTLRMKTTDKKFWGRMAHRGEYNEPTWLNRLTVDNNTNLYVTGDDRVNDHVALAVITTLWLRNHNRIAEDLGMIDFGTDDEIFTEARLQNMHQYQKVSMYDQLAAFAGTSVNEDDYHENGGYSRTTGGTKDEAEVLDGYVAVNALAILALHGESVPRLDDFYREIEAKHLTGPEMIGTASYLDDGETDMTDTIIRGLTFTCHGKASTPNQYFINKGALDDWYEAAGRSKTSGRHFAWDTSDDLVAAAIVRTRDMGVPQMSELGDFRKFSSTYKGRREDICNLYNDPEDSGSCDGKAVDAVMMIFGDEGDGTGYSVPRGVVNAFKEQVLYSAKEHEDFFYNNAKFDQERRNAIWDFRLKNLIEYNTAVGSSLLNAFFQADGKQNVMSEAVSSGLHDGNTMVWSEEHDEYDKFFELDAWAGVSTRVVNDETIDFLIEVKTTGWVALGFAPVGGHGMLDTDCMYCKMDKGALTLWDMKAYRIGFPRSDTGFPDGLGTDDYTNKNGSEVDGHTICKWTRPLVTPDPHDRNISRGSYKGTFAYNYLGQDRGYHGPTRGFYETVYWDELPPVVVIEEEDPLPKIMAGIVIAAVLGLAVFGYFLYMKKRGSNEFQLEKAMSEDEQRKRDLMAGIKLHVFWLVLDCFDLGSDVASLIFAISGEIGNMGLTYLFAAFVSLSIAVSSKVLTSRTKKIIDCNQQLKGDANAKIIGNATYKDMFVHLGRSKKSLAAEQAANAGKAQVVPVTGDDSSSTTEANNIKDEARFKRQILEYADAVTGLYLIRWVLLLMCMEDLPSLAFNLYFIGTVWPVLEGMEIPVVSIMITTLSIGYKLTYLQKYQRLKKAKANEERNFAEIGIDQATLVAAISQANKKRKNKHVEGAFTS